MTAQTIRIGTFYIERDVIDRVPEHVLLIMAKCIVVRAEMMYERDAIRYVALCSEFREIQRHSPALRYVWMFSADVDGTVTVHPEEAR